MSEQQQATLDFIRDFTEEKGYAPSEVEIADWFGISRQAASKRIDTLEGKGLVERTPNAHRTIRVVK